MASLETITVTGHPVDKDLERDLSLNERELLREIFRALRAIRYGSVVLTVHDGHIVEIQKTERIRSSATKQ